MNEKTGGGGVKSVTKAFAILEALDKHEELSISEMSEMLSLDKTTVHRIVNTIKDSGFVVQNPATKKYANSMKFYTYGRNVLRKNQLSDIARPYIRQIAQITGETVNLGIMVETSVVYIDRVQSEMSVQVATSTGRSIPLHCTGMGKAILAFLDPSQIKEISERTELLPYTKNTAVTVEELEKRLEEVREKGYSLDNEEFEDGLIAFGAPIFNADGAPIAAISISCPKVRFSGERHTALYSKLLTDAATIISMKLGYQPQ